MSVKDARIGFVIKMHIQSKKKKQKNILDLPSGEGNNKCVHTVHVRTAACPLLQPLSAAGDRKDDVISQLG